MVVCGRRQDRVDSTLTIERYCLHPAVISLAKRDGVSQRMLLI
jgi:hypothetical protein